jgi:hypothetical protein
VTHSGVLDNYCQRFWRWVLQKIRNSSTVKSLGKIKQDSER